MVDFSNIEQAVVGNAQRAQQLFATGGVPASNLAFKRLAILMTARAMELGVNGITYGDARTDVTLGEAFTDTGREAWAVVLQAQALLELSGVDARSALFVAPQQPCEYEFESGARPMLDTSPGSTSAGLSLCALDAATQHALLLGIASKGYTLEQWGQLPDDPESDLRDISFEPFLMDLELSWAGLLQDTDQGLKAAPLSEQMQRWPELMTVDSDAGAYQRIMQRHELSQGAGFTQTVQPVTEKPQPEQVKRTGPSLG